MPYLNSILLPVTPGRKLSAELLLGLSLQRGSLRHLLQWIDTALDSAAASDLKGLPTTCISTHCLQVNTWTGREITLSIYFSINQGAYYGNRPCLIPSKFLVIKLYYIKSTSTKHPFIRRVASNSTVPSRVFIEIVCVILLNEDDIQGVIISKR